MNANHLAKTPSWGTPPAIVEMARNVMGGIDIDASSSHYWNEHLVRARDFYHQYCSPLDLTSHPVGRWFFNPPGGLVKEFFRLAMDRHLEGSTVFWVGFSVEQLAYLQPHVFNSKFVRCIPRSRIRFMVEADDGPPKPGKSPTHSNYLLLMPQSDEQRNRFEAEALKLNAGVF